MGDLSQVRLVEEGQLERAVADQRLDLPGAQCGDPVQARGTDILAQPCCGQHAAVAGEDHAGDPEPVLDFGHLAGDGLRVAGVALEHLDGDRDAILAGEQPVGDLQAAADPVFGVADRAERAGPPLERGGRNRAGASGSPNRLPLGPGQALREEAADHGHP